jgi:hypothetical protein
VPALPLAVPESTKPAGSCIPKHPPMNAVRQCKIPVIVQLLQHGLACIAAKSTEKHEACQQLPAFPVEPAIPVEGALLRAL